MFAKERQEEIIKKVNNEGSVRVKELSDLFKVSEDCIRKDLTFLQNQGLLKKAYGGAVRISENPHLYRIQDRKNMNKSEREKIALKAVELIENHDTIFLDISVSSIEIAKLLVTSSLDITIMTNMIEILPILSLSQHSLIFIGGQINKERDGFDGVLSIDLLRKFRIDKAFLGVVGIDIFRQQLTTYHVEDGLMKSAIIEQSQMNYVLCESKKFSEYGNYIYASFKDIDALILDEMISQVSTLEELGLQVY